MAKVKDTEKVLAEIGHSGVNIDFLEFTRDAEKDLRFPYSVQTYDKMARSAVISATLAAINTIVSQVTFTTESYDQTDVHKGRKAFLDQCLFKDMETPFSTFILEAMTIAQYGFAVHEKVFRYRNYDKGSKYDDGRIGIKYLPLRAQHSIAEIKYDDNNRKLAYVKQKPPLKVVNGSSVLVYSDAEGKKIPADRLMMFRVDPTSNNPYGKSPLSRSYKSWRASEKLKDIEAVSVNRNLNGIPHLQCPSEILDADNDDPEAMKRVKDMKNSMGKFATGEQTYIITPSDRYDATEGGAAQYSFEVVSGSSSHITALSSVIVRYDNEIFQAMCADILTLDNGSSGGSGITTNKETMLNMFVGARVVEIVDMINNDLIPDLWHRNGWDTTKCPTLKHGRIERLTVDILAKAIQQLMATNSIPITVENVNHIMDVFGFPTRLPLDMSREDLIDVLGFNLEMQSKSGSGMKRGTVGEGTAKKLSGQDKNANNRSKT